MPAQSGHDGILWPRGRRVDIRWNYMFFGQACGLARSRYIVVILKEMWPCVVEAAEILLYLCGCCRRAAPAGDLGLVDTVARG